MIMGHKRALPWYVYGGQRAKWTQQWRVFATSFMCCYDTRRFIENINRPGSGNMAVIFHHLLNIVKQRVPVISPVVLFPDVIPL